MNLWKKFSLARLFRSANHPRPHAARFRPTLLDLEDRTVPAADLFAGATLLSGSLVTATGSNAAATAEFGEPAGEGTSGAINSVWWKWTATTSGAVEVNTVGSDFDTLLAVYTGSAVDDLTLVAANDDAHDTQSQLVFEAVAGTTYRIAVDGFDDTTGDIVLNLGTTPANDNFANATVVDGGTVNGSNLAATGETGEPLDTGSNPPVNSVWWSWTASAGGEVTIDTVGSDFDTVLGVYTGSAVDDLTLVAQNDDFDFPNQLTSRVVFNAEAGTTYRIAVDGYLNETGHIVLNLPDATPSNTAPTISAQSFNVNENSAAGTVVGTVSASDADAGQTLSYAITGGNGSGAFAIDSATGQITVADAAALNYETNSSFTLTVCVTDSCTPALSCSATVTVNVNDVNEAAVFGDVGPFGVNENSAAGTVVGAVSASDADAGQTLSYAIVGGNTSGAFAINATTGQITVANAAALDYETNPSFTLTVRATDSGSPALSSTTAVTVNVSNGNDAPVFGTSGSFSVNENSAAGTVVGTVSASDADASQTLSYSIVGGNTSGAFAINSTTGQITVANAAALNYEATASFTLSIRVTDNGSPAMSATAGFTVNLNNVNDAPVLDNSGSMSLNAINMGQTNNNGTLVSELLASAGGNRISDQDAGAMRGIAITAADTSHGSWQFSLDGGATWRSLGSVSNGSARLLSADARIRFVPSLLYSGTVTNALTFRAWDQTTGVNGGLADTTTNGGTTAFSAVTETASIRVKSLLGLLG